MYSAFMVFLAVGQTVMCVKEAHMHRMVSEAEDCNTSCSQIQVDDMACQLEPGGFVISCTQPTMASANLASSSSHQTQNLPTNSTTVSFTFNTPVKLDQSNYLIWRSQVLASIRGNRLEKFIDGSITPPLSHIAQRVDDELRSVENPEFITWRSQDHVLFGWLLSSMSEGIISLVFNLETSLEVWKAIKVQFGSQSKSRLLHLRYMMNSTRKDDMKITDYFIKMKNIADNMAAPGSALSSDDLILHVLSGLGPDYNSVATYITGQVGVRKMNVNEAYAMLLTQEARIEQQSQMLAGGRGFSGYGYNSRIGNGGYYKGNFGTDSAGAGTGFNTQFRGYQSGNQRGGGGGNWNNNNGVGNFNNGKPPMNSKPQWNTSKPTCQICLRPGHTANICWKLEEFITSGAYRPPPNRGPKAAYLANMDALADTNWYLDSGATHHLTNDLNNMHMAESFAGTSKLVIGNGVGLCITHTGYAVLRMQSSVNKFELKLDNILLVPKITKNMISISKLTRDNDVVVEFTNDFYFVKDKVRNLIMLQGKAKKGLYRLLLVSAKKSSPYLSNQGFLAHVQSAVSTQPISMFSAVNSKCQNKTASQSHTEAQYSQDSDCMLSTMILHQKLGHPNAKVLSHVINSCPSFKTINGNKVFDSCDAWYNPLHKGYKCLHSSWKVYIASHVLFDETSFPYSTDPTFLHSMPSKSSDFLYNSFQSFHISVPNSNQHPFEVASAGTDSHTSSSTHNIISLPFTTLPAATSNTTPAGTSNTTPAGTSNTTPVATLNTTPAETPNITPAIISNTTPLSTINQTSPDMPLSTSRSLSSPPQSIISTHPMITRAKAGIFKPKAFLTAHNSLEPSNISEAFSDSKWKAAMQDEFDALIRNKTWSLVPMDPEYKLVGCKWVFRTKYNIDGSVSKYKARLVAKGFHQTAGVDYSETFSPVVKSSTVRVILSLAVMQGWKVRQIDVNNAFLNGDLTEDVFMQQPEGFVSEGGYVCKLNKALYGLKQAPRAWYDKLKGCLTSWNFTNSKADTSLFIRHDVKGIILILIYVDDILITGPDSDLLESFIAKLSKVFALKDLGLVTYFLSVEVCYTDNGMHLSQTKYIKDLLSKASMQNYKETDTPFSTGYKLERSAKGSLGAEFENATLYRSIVGGLQYLILTRPDIAYSIHKLSQYLSAPTLQHWLACKKVLRYLQATVTYGLYIQKEGTLETIGLTGYSDADWACDIDDRKSIGAYCIFLGNNLVSWSSKKQAIVAKSSTESEYRALSAASSEISWLQSLFSELNITKLPTPVLCYFRSKLNVFSRPLSLRGDVKEAHMHRMVSEAEDCNTSCSQIQVDDMACQLEPGGFEKLDLVFSWIYPVTLSSPASQVPNGVRKYLAGNILPSDSVVICGLAKNQVYSYSEVAFVISEEEAKTVEVLEGTTALIDQSFLPIPSPVKAAIFESFARQNNVGFPVDTNTDFIYADCSQSLFNKLVICCILEGGTIHYASQQAPMGSIYVSAAKFLKAIIVNIHAQSEVGFDTCDNTRSRL
ncbi:retrovirus-related pol polyprotein from transposon RE1 [Citrus sinensis]|uniref:Retrovirus-related pol polyprotein from transposon RE1 n=1 Tax=Citrus sinensis TaxID=2711 RepID=A0ACB8K6Z9_CITSI|nr:retrovirus-related pol polyprotein from transposon RE1 [Citrus sinensis]